MGVVLGTLFGIIALLFLGLFVIIFIIHLNTQEIFKHLSQQSGQVEVVRKRLYEGGTGDSIIISYIVGFKFPDGSVKEFEACRPRRRVYASLQIGDTGLLIYKEREDARERLSEDLRWNDRRFINFEKDL